MNRRMQAHRRRSLIELIARAVGYVILAAAVVVGIWAVSVFYIVTFCDPSRMTCS
jgi:hypothetical protein